MQQYRGSYIPKNTEKIEIYYAISIFIIKEQKANVNVLETKLIDYKYIAENAQAIFDAKNAMKNIDERDNIEVL